MSAQTSIAPTVLLALEAVVTAAVANVPVPSPEAAIHIEWGDPKGKWREQVVMGDVEDPAEKTWAALGNRSRDDRFVVGFQIWSVRPGKSHKEATLRVWEILSYIEAELVATPAAPKLGISAADAQNVTVRVATATSTQVVTTEGDGCVLTWKIEVNARLAGP